MVYIKHREFVCTERPPDDLDEKQYGEFYISLCEAVISSLVKRQILNGQQKKLLLDRLGKYF